MYPWLKDAFCYCNIFGLRTACRILLGLLVVFCSNIQSDGTHNYRAETLSWSYHFATNLAGKILVSTRLMSISAVFTLYSLLPDSITLMFSVVLLNLFALWVVLSHRYLSAQCNTMLVLSYIYKFYTTACARCLSEECVGTAKRWVWLMSYSIYAECIHVVMYGFLLLCLPAYQECL
jgi:hypothetical protein